MSAARKGLAERILYFENGENIMKHKTWKRLASIALSLALALEIAVLADILLVFFGLRLTPVQFAALLGALFVGTLACRFLTVKRKMVLCTAVPAAVAALSLGCFAVWYGFRGDGAYAIKYVENTF